jgi:hypothetical protein
VEAWVDELTDDLLARGEASLTTCRGSVGASLRRPRGPGRLRKGELSTRVTGGAGYSSTGGATLTSGHDLREELTFYLTFEVLSLAGM